jgi:hypothetical protein
MAVVEQGAQFSSIDELRNASQNSTVMIPVHTSSKGSIMKTT